MPKNPKPEPFDPEQSKRFVENAKALDAEPSGKAFARAFKNLVPQKTRGGRRKAAKKT
jgi:hypothetical protein